MKIKRNISRALILFTIGIIGGAYTYSYLENWSLLDAFYFVIATVTTIGYGDFVPTTSIAKIFTMFYSFFGVGIALYIFSTINSAIFKKHVGQKVSEIKQNVKKEQEIKEEVKDTIKKAIRKKNKKKK
ncbi:MAG: potassium channel family protein [Candidatus Pacearchaeota archaeon]|nr:potassium channel family protein [Candidatus Pacearchaeota archaeon]